MEFGHTVNENVLVITPRGETLDAKVAPEFNKKSSSIITNYNLPNVLFDLHELQFVDSSGLGAFLAALRLLNKKGGKLKLACLSKPVQNIFETVSFNRVFETFPNVEEAIKSFK